MSTGFYSIGVSGLAAAQLGLLATEHNVVNANTPGYTRQRTVQATNLPVNTGAGAIGQGVNVVTIERMYDKYLTAQVASAQTKVSEIDAYYGEIKQIDNLLADPTAGLTPALQDFFSGVQQVAANPSLLSARQSMISSAETLVSRFQSLDSRLSELRDEVNGRIGDSVSNINALSTQIADLNQRIILSESSYGQPANDLLDQRDQLVNDLNQLIKVTTSTNSNGGFNVFIGTGQQLVVGNRAMTMTAAAASSDPSKIVVGLQTAGGGVLEMPESMIVGGELGGLVRFRNETLNTATNELGRLSASIALTFNAQNKLGQDLLGRANGEAGFNADFFSTGLMTPLVSANARNAGTAVVSAAFAAPTYGPEVNNGNFYTKLTTSDYQLNTVSVDPLNGSNNTYSLTRLSDSTKWPTTGALSLAALSTVVESSEGFSLAINSPATDAVGNSYLIQPTKNAANNLQVNPVVAADPRTIAAALPFSTTAVASNTGTGAISSGTGVPGFSSSLLPASGISIAYSSAAPASLSFSGLVAGQSITYKVPGTVGETSYTVPALPAQPRIPYSQGMAVSVNGMSVVMTGQPNNGDTFKIQRNTAASADARNALALGKLQTQSTVAGASATFQTAYAEMVARNGIKARELAVMGAAQQTVLDQAQASRDALSGVNLDEEAANMIRYQQAYQASAKILEVGKTLFDSILQLG